MGTRPMFGAERAEYERVARLLADYRARYGIEGTEPLGDRPLEAHQRAAYEAVVGELRRYERRLGRSRELVGTDLGMEL